MKKYIHLPKHDILLPTEGLYLTQIRFYTNDKPFVEEKYSGIFGTTKTRLVINKNQNKIHYFEICNLSQTIYIKITKDSYKEVKEIWDGIAEAIIDEPKTKTGCQIDMDKAAEVEVVIHQKPSRCYRVNKSIPEIVDSLLPKKNKKKAKPSKR